MAITQETQEKRPKVRIFFPEATPDVEYIGQENLYRHYRGTERISEAKPVLITPIMGYAADVAIEYLAQGLGILTLTGLKRNMGKTDSFVPPPVTGATISLGVADAPEGMCTPFKIVDGYFMERAKEFEKLRQETNGEFYPLFLTHASTGFCREKEYGPMGELHLRDYYQKEFRHKNFDFYVYKESKKGILEFLSFLGQLSEKNRPQMMGIINEALGRLVQVEAFEDRVRYAQSLGVGTYETEVIFKEVREIMADSQTSMTTSTLKSQRAKLLELTEKAEKEGKKPLGIVAITGEVYFCQEIAGFSSGFIGLELVKRGFYYRKDLGLGKYLASFRSASEKFFKSSIRELNPFTRDIDKELAAKVGLAHDAGGHSIGYAALIRRIEEAKLKGEEIFDGVLVISPFLCQPVTVTRNVLTETQRKVHQLSITIDEQTGGAAGIITRIEAFLDMLRREKRKKV